MELNKEELLNDFRAFCDEKINNRPKRENVGTVNKMLAYADDFLKWIEKLNEEIKAEATRIVELADDSEFTKSVNEIIGSYKDKLKF